MSGTATKSSNDLTSTLGAVKDVDSHMKRLVFFGYVFGPILLCYLVPLIAYELPLNVKVWHGAYALESSNMINAVAACFTWFGIVFVLSVFPFKRGQERAAPRDWNLKTVLWVFVFFSIFGSLAAVTHRFVVLPSTLDQLIHKAALIPTLAVFLGLHWLCQTQGVARWDWRMGAVLFLLIIDFGVVFLVPLVFLTMGPVVFSVIALSYALSTMGVSWRKHALVIFVLGVIVLGLQPFKSYLRNVWLGGEWGRTPVQLSCSDVKEESQAQPASRQNPLPPSSVDPATIFERDKSLYILPAGVEPPKTYEEALRLSNPPGGVKPPTTYEEDKRLYMIRHDPNYRRIAFLNLLSPMVDQGGTFYYAVAKILNRLNHLGELAYVMRHTGVDIPFAKGETYRPMLTKLVPRMLWKDKPREEAGQLYGHRYGFLEPVDHATSANLSIVIEGYMNWGWFGIVGSAILLGALTRLVWEFIIGKDPRVGSVMLGMVFLMTIVNQESNLSLVVGGLLTTWILYWLLEVFIRRYVSSRISGEA